MNVTLASALLLASAVAAAEPPGPSRPTASPPPIAVSIRGPIDPALVVTSLASELARPVAQLPGSAGCHAPCLAIAVDATAATVTFTGGAGVTRQRTIALPADREEWPVLITLLAGNLVRDEADQLLADAPTPPSAAAAAGSAPVAGPSPSGAVGASPSPSAPVAAPVVIAPGAPAPGLPAPVEVNDRFAPFAVSLVPGVSSDLFDLQRSHALSIGLVAGSSGHVRGVALSGAVDVARSIAGGQLAGAVAVTGALDGLQVGGAVTVAGHSRGAQLAGAVAVAHDLRGAELAGAVAVAGDSSGTQIAGAATVARASRGTQIAGAATVAGASRGLQIAGGVNVTGELAGTQIAGGVNVARHATGLQIAPINVARRNDGLQVGVLNIGGGPDGESFGLINIVPGGRTDLEAAVDSDATGTVLLRHGGRHWHNVYGIAGQRVDEAMTATTGANDDLWMYGLGVGPSFHVAGLPTDLEVMAWHVSHGDAHDAHLSLLSQLRVTVAIPVGAASIVAGGAINTYVTTDHASPLVIARTMGEPMGSDVLVKLWPTLFVGVRL